MKILFVEPRYYTYKLQRHFPIGQAYVGAALLAAGHEVVGFNANTGPDDAGQVIDSIIGLLREGQFAMLACGGLCTTYVFQKQLFLAVRAACPHVLLLSGGNLLTAEPEFCFDRFSLDYALLGEAEESMPELCAALEAGKRPELVAGLVYRDPHDASIHRSAPRKVVKDLDALPYPAYEMFCTPQELIDGGSMLIFTSRSCPFHCTFCYHPKGSYYRKRSVANIMGELNFLHQTYGIKSFGFGDELFALDKAWTLEFCDAVERLPFLNGWRCQMRASDADPAILQRMRQAGCRDLSMGFESGSDAVLKSMRKRISVAVSRQAIKTVREAGISITGGVILGDFAETPETVAETVEFVKETALLPVEDLGLIVPYPGSAIYERCLKEGIIADKEAFLESLCSFGKLRVNMTTLSDAELLALQEQASQQIFSHFLTHFRGEVEQVLEQTPEMTRFSTSCPSCGYGHEITAQGLFFEKHFNCERCRRPVFIDPFAVPHMHHATLAARQAIAQLPPFKQPDVLVTPVGIEYMRLQKGLGLPPQRIKGFLDASRERLRHAFQGKTVFMRDAATIRQLAPKAIVICSTRWQEQILADLADFDLEGVQVIPLFQECKTEDTPDS